MIQVVKDDYICRVVKYDRPEEREEAITLLQGPLDVDLLAVHLPSDPMRQPGYVGYRK